MKKIDQTIFDENLQLTRAYCDFRLRQFPEKNSAEVLRSINPVFKGVPLFSFEQLNDYVRTDWYIDPLATENKAVYDDFFEIQLRQKKEFFKNKEIDLLANGEILITGIDQIICDGASEMMSNGFIDNNDCTPIDTWFYMANNGKFRVLFSWIPAQFIGLVEEGINVNMLATFEWYNKESGLLEESVATLPNKRNVVNHRQPSLFARIFNLFR